VLFARLGQWKDDDDPLLLRSFTRARQGQPTNRENLGTQ
jgi:hypothetical protein